MMSIQITIADLLNPEHAQAFITLLDTYAKDPMGGGKGLSTFVKENLPTELNKRDNAIVLLAFDNKKPVGLLNAIEGFSTFSCKPLMNIHDVSVVMEYRGRGISKLLFETIEKHAISKGCCKMTLEVLAINTVAKSAYTQFGYTESSLGNTHFWTKNL